MLIQSNQNNKLDIISVLVSKKEGVLTRMDQERKNLSTNSKLASLGPNLQQYQQVKEYQSHSYNQTSN